MRKSGVVFEKVIVENMIIFANLMGDIRLKLYLST